MNEKLVSSLRTAACTLEKGGNENLANLIREAAEIIKLQAEKNHTLNNGGWVPCSERLPEEDGIYIIDDKRHHESSWIHTAGFMKSSRSWCENHGVYYDDGYGRYDEQEKIIAWMPLPEAWKGEEE